MQSYKFEHEKEIAKEIVRNKLVEFEYTITSEKSINNDFGYKFCGDKFAVQDLFLKKPAKKLFLCSNNVSTMKKAIKKSKKKLFQYIPPLK